MGVEKKSPREVLESVKNPQLEYSYVKFPGKEMVDVSSSQEKDSVKTRWGKVRSLWRRNDKKPYTHIHTHPVPPECNTLAQEIQGSMPSYNDVNNFMIDDDQKMMVVAQTNAENKNLNGYFILRKTRKTPKTGITQIPSPLEKLKNSYFPPSVSPQLEKKLRWYAYLSSQDNTERGIEELAKTFHLQYRFVPASRKDIYEGRMKGKESYILGVTAASCLFFSFLGSVKSFTGNVIGLSEHNTSVIAIAFLFMGLVTGFFWLKSKKN